MILYLYVCLYIYTYFIYDAVQDTHIPCICIILEKYVEGFPSGRCWEVLVIDLLIFSLYA